MVHLIIYITEFQIKPEREDGGTHAEQCILAVLSPKNKEESDTSDHQGGASAKDDHHHSCCVLKKKYNERKSVADAENCVVGHRNHVRPYKRQENIAHLLEL